MCRANTCNLHNIHIVMMVAREVVYHSLSCLSSWHPNIPDNRVYIIHTVLDIEIFIVTKQTGMHLQEGTCEIL